MSDTGLPWLGGRGNCCDLTKVKGSKPAVIWRSEVRQRLAFFTDFCSDYFMWSHLTAGHQSPDRFPPWMFVIFLPFAPVFVFLERQTSLISGKSFLIGAVASVEYHNFTFCVCVACDFFFLEALALRAVQQLFCLCSSEDHTGLSPHPEKSLHSFDSLQLQRRPTVTSQQWSLWAARLTSQHGKIMTNLGWRGRRRSEGWLNPEVKDGERKNPERKIRRRWDQKKSKLLDEWKSGSETQSCQPGCFGKKNSSFSTECVACPCSVLVSSCSCMCECAVICSFLWLFFLLSASHFRNYASLRDVQPPLDVT